MEREGEQDAVFQGWDAHYAMGGQRWAIYGMRGVWSAWRMGEGVLTATMNMDSHIGASEGSMHVCNKADKSSPEQPW